MSWLIADTLIQARAIRSRIDTALGLPRAASASGVIGAGQTRVIGVTYLESGSPKLAIWANGSIAASTSTSTWNGTPASPSASNPAKQLGALNYVSSFDQGYGGSFARLLVWNRVLTTAERAAIVAALNRIYGAS